MKFVQVLIAALLLPLSPVAAQGNGGSQAAQARYGPYAYIVTNIQRRYWNATDDRRIGFILQSQRWSVPADLYRLDAQDLQDLLFAATGALRGDEQAFNVLVELLPQGADARFFADSIVSVAGARGITVKSHCDAYRCTP